jgi:carboxyl-terminal processing protease
LRIRLILGLLLSVAALPFLLKPALAQKRVAEIEFPKPADFQEMSWIDAFDALHKKLSTEYAFTDWRRIDWPALYAKYSPRIVDSQLHNDKIAYQMALREYVYSIPDGHVGINGDETALRANHIAGGYGFGIAPLTDGRFIAHVVTPEGPAAKAGMKAGAEILRFNTQPIKEAVSTAPTIWSVGSPATTENRLLEQARYLTRAPVGTAMQITFRNPGELKTRTVSLTATDDAGVLLKRTGPNYGLGPDVQKLYYEVLPSGYGYVRIPHEAGDTLTQFTAAMKFLVDKKVPGIIVDLRSNQGGEDQVAADMGSFFHTKKSFYEYGQFYNVKTGTFDILTKETVYVAPHQPHFDGPVIGLIGPSCVSSGEGVAWQIGRAPKGMLLGFAGTNGSFGMSGMTAKMPGGATVHFPFGASLDEKGVVQIDSDYTGKGGIQPTIRIPRTYETMMAVGGGKDVELELAQKVMDKRLVKGPSRETRH